MGSCYCACMNDKTFKTVEVQTEMKSLKDHQDKYIQHDSIIITANSIPKQNAEILEEIQSSGTTQDNRVIFLQAAIKGFTDRKKYKALSCLISLKEVPKTISTAEARQAYSRLPPFKFDKAQGDEPVDWKGPTKLLDGSIYVGEWSCKGLPHGKGIMYYVDGGICEGYWKDGKLHGGGRRVSPKGDVFIGNWINGKMHGQGVMDYANKSKYTGTWMDDKQHGFGIEVWADESRFEGDYVSGLKCGKGKLFWADGTRYEGEFLGDIIEGFGKYVWNDREYEGQWKGGKMHGKGVFKWKDGKRYEGEYVNDVKEGFGTIKWPDGKMYEGYWKDGKYHGGGVLMIRGKKRSGVWENGELQKKVR